VRSLVVSYWLYHGQRGGAEGSPHIHEVRLFGSRAKGCARPNSDIDLALTLGGNDPGTILGNYFALHRTWQDELTSLLGVKAHVALYRRVRRYCDECSFVLFP
jgi:predicted nucleotidyltransferase